MGDLTAEVLQIKCHARMHRFVVRSPSGVPGVLLKVNVLNCCEDKYANQNLRQPKAICSNA